MNAKVCMILVEKVQKKKTDLIKYEYWFIYRFETLKKNTPLY